MYECVCKICEITFEHNIKNTEKCKGCKKINYKHPRNYGREETKSVKWKKAVKLRDNNECQECHTKPQIVHAHHIKSWSKYPELRFDISNGITLCEPCHKAKHTHRE
jgi:5-methylcytosine-specific restriction endonuclease McrA